MLTELRRISDYDLEVNLARNDYSFYLEYTHRGLYTPAKHTDLICDSLERIEKGSLKRLMIWLPPRHSKSMTVSESFPSYFIGKNPERRVIETSYGDNLAKKFGRANRSKVEQYGPSLFNICLSRANSSVTNWGIEGHRGGMISAGIGGPITGEGADLLIIDDPIKNRAEANSPVYREMVWNEWQNTLLTRLHPGAAIIIILTRWHEDDLAGRLLELEPEKWEVISLPAEAEQDDLLGRPVGAPLWPEYGYDAAWMLDKKREVGSQVWASLYQQRPSPAEGNIIQREWLKYYTALPSRFDEVIQSWDCSFKDSKASKSGVPDYVVGQIWGRKGAGKYLLDQIRGRLGFSATIRAIQSMTQKWPQARAKLIEDKANGPAVIDVLKDKIPGLIAVEPQGDKIARLQAVSPDFEAGNIYLPSPTIAVWVSDYIEELVSFPTATNDDQVDATSQALIRLGTGRRRVRMTKQKPIGW